MIKEYRKKSADIIFLNQFSWAKPLYKFTSLFWPSWQPDKDANQREMIEQWLIEQGWGIDIDRNQKSTIIVFWKNNPKGDDFIHTSEDKFKSIAFMMTFMKYINQTES